MGDQPQARAARRQHLRRTAMVRRVAQRCRCRGSRPACFARVVAAVRAAIASRNPGDRAVYRSVRDRHKSWQARPRDPRARRVARSGPARRSRRARKPTRILLTPGVSHIGHLHRAPDRAGLTGHQKPSGNGLTRRPAGVPVGETPNRTAVGVRKRDLGVRAQAAWTENPVPALPWASTVAPLVARCQRLVC